MDGYDFEMIETSCPRCKAPMLVASGSDMAECGACGARMRIRRASSAFGGAGGDETEGSPQSPEALAQSAAALAEEATARAREAARSAERLAGGTHAEVAPSPLVSTLPEPVAEDVPTVEPDGRPQPTDSMSSPAPAPAPDVNGPHPMTVRDKSGRALARVTVPDGWTTAYAGVNESQGTGDWPWLVSFSLSDGHGATISYKSPRQYVRRGATMRRILATYSTPATQMTEPPDREFPIASALLDQELQTIVRGHVTDARTHGWARPPLPAGEDASIEPFETKMGQMRRSDIENEARRMGGSVRVDDIYARRPCRKYSMTIDGVPHKAAMYAILVGEKVDYTVGMPGGGMMGLGGMLGGLLGSLSQPMQAQSPMGGQAMPGMNDDARAQAFRQAGPSQDISWTILAELCLVAPAERFDEVFDGAFVDVANSVTLDQGLMEERARINFSRQQQVQAATNQAIGQMQMQFATWQQMHAQQQQAFDAQLRTWQANSDAHHRAFRQRSQEQFYGSPAGSGGAGDFSEAIRGVNTYVDKYGHEVEMDVSAETVWQNEAGDIAGFDKGVNPGYGWTQLRQV